MSIDPIQRLMWHCISNLCRSCQWSKLFGFKKSYHASHKSKSSATWYASIRVGLCYFTPIWTGVGCGRASRQESWHFVFEYDCVCEGALFFLWSPKCSETDAAEPTVGLCKYPMQLAFFIRKRNSSHASDFCPSVGSTPGSWGVDSTALATQSMKTGMPLAQCAVTHTRAEPPLAQCASLTHAKPGRFSHSLCDKDSAKSTKSYCTSVISVMQHQLCSREKSKPRQSIS